MTESDDLAELLQRWEDAFDQGRDIVKELCMERPDLAPALTAEITALKRAKEFAEWSGGSAEGGPSSTKPPAPRGAGPLTLAVGAGPLPGYRLVRRVGAGAFGEVWAAESRDWGPVAVKFFHGSLDTAADRRRAERELEGLARIKKVSHPALLRIYHLEARGTTLVLVTELAKESLHSYFRRLRRRHHPPVRLGACALALLRDAAEALDSLQAEHGLLHLDVKPDNLLRLSERCVLSDFGTVSQVGPGRPPTPGVALYDPDTSATVVYRSCAEVPWGQALRPGATLFTALGAFSPYYAPPEAFRGHSSRSFDQYSLALTWCELVAGTIPFQGPREAQLAQRLAGALELGDWPEAVRPVLRRALSARPEDRYPSCVAFVEAACAALRPLAAGSTFAEDLLREGAEGSGSHRVPRLKGPPKRGGWKEAVWRRARAVPSRLLALRWKPFSLAGAGLRCLGRVYLRWGQNPAGWARTHLVLAIPLALAALLAFTFALWAQRLGPLTHPAPRPEQKQEQEQEPASQPKPKAPEAPLRLPKTLRSLTARPS